MSCFDIRTAQYLPSGLVIDDAADPYYWDNPLGSNTHEIIWAQEAGLYRLLLSTTGNSPTPQGWDISSTLVCGGSDLRDIADLLVTTTTFIRRVDSDRSANISNEELLDYMYGEVLEREADEDGYNWWFNELEAERKSQADVVLEITQSNEFILLSEMTVTQFELSPLG